MRSLQNAVSMAPGKEQARDNRMGDAFSQKESASILGSVCKDFDLPAKRLKEGIESLHLGPGMMAAAPRLKASFAKRMRINGVQMAGDNIDLVRIAQ